MKLLPITLGIVRSSGNAQSAEKAALKLQAVAVGDTLAGIGRISAITYQNGRWSIVGTQGAIQQ